MIDEETTKRTVRRGIEAMRDEWPKVFPEALAECSAPWQELTLSHVEDDGTGQRVEHWWSDTYTVTRRIVDRDPVFGSRGGMIILGISSEDGKARHDFRDFQKIKNQLAGEEWEAFELYPAESRLLDPSNYYLLWCFHVTIKVGQKVRRVLDQNDAFAPQRGFAMEVEPPSNLSKSRQATAKP